jgi:hypothetical protein
LRFFHLQPVKTQEKCPEAAGPLFIYNPDYISNVHLCKCLKLDLYFIDNPFDYKTENNYDAVSLKPLLDTNIRIAAYILTPEHGIID